MSLENISGKPKKSHDVRAIRADLQPEYKRRETRVRLNSSGLENDVLGRGVEGRVTRVTASIDGRETGSLAFKQFHNERAAMDAKRVWMRLKALGIPVPATHRLILDGTEKDGVYEGILMTELTEGWKNIFLTGSQGNIRMIDMVYSHNPDVIERFANEDFEFGGKIQELLKHCEEIAIKLTDANILLKGGDAIGAVYTNEGVLTPVVFDYGNISLDGTSEGDAQIEKDTILKRNLHTAKSLAVFVLSVQEDVRRKLRLIHD